MKGSHPAGFGVMAGIGCRNGVNLDACDTASPSMVRSTQMLTKDRHGVRVIPVMPVRGVSYNLSFAIAESQGDGLCSVMEDLVAIEPL